MRARRQSLHDARADMSPLWIALALLPILGGAERFNCRGRILGAYYADAKSGCKAFHVCVRVAGGGIRDFRFFCPPGTLFHQEAQTCTDWGDDDPLACPADLYDGQFDLYKIGSGFDTKKLSTPGAREEEAEFGLQRAETGDRRLAQSGGAPASDLRAAHSSDFFSGQRDRGRDDAAQPNTAAPRAPLAPSATPQRTSFRRPTSPRTTPTTHYTESPPPPPQHQNAVQYEPKRKLVRKRPYYSSSPAPTPSVTNTPQQQYTEPQQQNFDRRLPQNKPSPTTFAPATVPPQYKEEYVEVSRVTPKQNRYFSNNPSPAPFSQSTPYYNNNKKESKGLVELYNYNAQSTPGIKVQNDNRPFKVKNSYSIATDVPEEQDFVRTNVNNYNGRGTAATAEYNTGASRGFSASTPAFRSYNSFSYEPEKNNFVQQSNNKQNSYNSPSTTPTTIHTTTRGHPSYNLNTVAYNTNNGFNIQSANFRDNVEDDGQYRLPDGEDDGQYRPEQYERELLSGAHSLNIAASGNRLPEDQRQKGKTQKPPKPTAQTAAPRPFRPAPTTTTTAVPPTTFDPVFTTTYRPQTVSSQRFFDYYQTYTTTVRPSEPPVNQTTTNGYESSSTQRSPEPRPAAPSPRPPAPAPAPHPSTRAPHFAQPANNKEDNSYDYAYYDSDPGFSEYDHIEEFGKTKTKKV